MTILGGGGWAGGHWQWEGARHLMHSLLAHPKLSTQNCLYFFSGIRLRVYEINKLTLNKIF